MFFDRRVSVFWFSSFYLLESAPILAVAAVAGNVIGFFSPVGWPFVCTLLAAFFAHRLVLSIQFNNYLARKEAAGFAGVDVGPFNTINFLAYAAAFVGAVAGWHLAVYIHFFAVLGIVFIFLPAFYFVEIVRRSQEF